MPPARIAPDAELKSFWVGVLVCAPRLSGPQKYLTTKWGDTAQFTKMSCHPTWLFETQVFMKFPTWLILGIPKNMPACSPEGVSWIFKNIPPNAELYESQSYQ